MREHIKYSPDKMWIICHLIRNRSVDDAVKQLRFMCRKGAEIAIEVLLEAQEKAVKEHNIEFRSNLWITDAFSMKSMVIKGLRRHARGRYGIVHYKYCNLYIHLEEGLPPAPDAIYQERVPDGWQKMTNYVQNMRDRKIKLGW